jgi:predicted AAA+ superfamily ATPase
MALAFGEDATEATLRTYLDALRRLYVLEELPGWSPNLRSSAKLRKSPKRFLVDPSLAVAGLGATPLTLRDDLNTLGFVFEAMCLRDLLVLADNLGASVAHYSEASGLEADAVWTLPDGRWAAFEIKLGHNQVDDAARHLLALAEKLAAQGVAPPAALVVIVGVGAIAQTRPDGVHVVPVGLLGL